MDRQMDRQTDDRDFIGRGLTDTERLKRVYKGLNKNYNFFGNRF